MILGREQRAAAAAGGGPVRVVAGAGTGKTAVIAERFRRLVAAGASAESILVMTFTERAAAEMRQRIEDLVGVAAPSVGTFHSMVMGWLREDGRPAGVQPGFRILAGAERWILARELMWEIGDLALTGDERPDDLVAPALSMLERLKQELVPLERLHEWAKGSEDRERAELMLACVRLYRAYEKACRSRGLLDFDDLLLLTVRLFEQHPQTLQRYAARFPHVLVDEYQDLNLAQEKVVELLARDAEPFIVGDDDQSIYRFRGASRASLERFLQRFPAARTITLGRNRRSSRRIVAAASALIGHNGDRLGKELRSDHPGPAVETWTCDTGKDEAEAIAGEARRLAASGVPLSRIAVLCRTNAIARPVAAALAAQGLPYVLVGGHGFYDQPEVKDLVALLRVMRDPTDLVALARALTRPPFSLDTSQALSRLRDRKGATPMEALRAWPPASAAAEVLQLLAAHAAEMDVRDLFFELMERTRYLEVATATGAPGEAARTAANVERFAESLAEFCEGSPDHSLEAFMRHLDLVLLSGEDEEPAAVEGVADAIQVMTIHQSKGLEFDAVFVPSLVEGRLPQYGRSPRFELPPAVLEPLVRGREDVLGEERRLLYVAMTRARAHLYLTSASHYDGARRWRESRFLDEVRSAGARTVVHRKIPTGAAPPAGPSLVRRPGAVHLSFSSIAAYLDCPRQHWYRYEQRLPAPQSAEAVHGTVLHEVLRRTAELRSRSEPVTAEAVRAIHETVWSETRFPDERREPTFRRIGLEELEAFRAAGGFEGEPVYLERQFRVELDGWTLDGVIDRIDRREDGWRIIDYKSGRPLTRRRRDLQVALYALGATGSLDLNPVELEVVYLASGDRVAIKDVDSLVAQAREQASEVAAAVAQGRFEARPDRRRCRLCPYRLACAEAL